MDLQSGYNVPGVYVRDDTGPLVTNAGVPDSVVTLVGPGTGFKTAAEAIEISAAGTLLSNQGIWLTSGATGAPAGVTSVKVTDLSGRLLTLGDDYTLSVIVPATEGIVGALTTVSLGPLTTLPATGGGTDYTATANGVKSGDQVIVSYCYTDATYYTPLVFEDFDLVEETYGDALLKERPVLPTTSQIVSPLTFAALIAFANNATRVVCVATNPADGSFAAQLREAYAKTEGDYSTDLIVPILATSDNGDPAAFAGYASDLRAHCEEASTDGYQRIGFIGAAVNYNNAGGSSTPPAFDLVAKGIVSKRVALAFPHRLSFYNSGTGRVFDVDGYYLAAAYAARLAAGPVNQGLTQENIFGFAGFPASITKMMTKQYKDRLSAAGVAVTEINRSGQMVVRHGVSTDMSSAITREISVTRARDALFEMLQIGLDSSGLIGAPIDPEMTTRVKGAVAGILETALASATIIAYADLKVRQQTTSTGGDPTVIEVKFAYQPTLPLNYVMVAFTLNLESGAVSLTNAA